MTRRTLLSQGYEAQLFTDSRPGSTHVFHYIVTKRESPGIVAWGQEETEEEAERAVMDYIKAMHGRAMGKSA